MSKLPGAQDHSTQTPGNLYPPGLVYGLQIRYSFSYGYFGEQ